MKVGKNKMALDLLQRGLMRHPTLGSALTLKGRALAALGRTGEAREILLNAAGANPENVAARKLLARIYDQSGDVEKLAQIKNELTLVWPAHFEGAPRADSAPQTADHLESAVVEEVVAEVQEEAAAYETAPAETELVAVKHEETIETPLATAEEQAAVVEYAPPVKEQAVAAEDASPAEEALLEEIVALAEVEAKAESPQPQIDPAVKTLEKWLGNATRMMKGGHDEKNSNS
ncbi:MAG: hypothetical protein HY280_04475 [Nitrospinae bacterium]|nr:hypothetical protein [Nitrospinota bacterium]